MNDLTNPDAFNAAWERLDDPAEIRAAMESDQLAEDELERLVNMEKAVYRAPDGEHFRVAYIRNDGVVVTDSGRWLTAAEFNQCKRME